MNILLFSDLHANTHITQQLVEQAPTFDLLIGAGDFGNVRKQLQMCINILQTTNRLTILVAGNNETTEELRIACRNWPLAHILHGEALTLDGLEFYGVGGGIPVTPFGSWSYDFTENQARDLLADCPTNCILVTHSPPKGLVDISPEKENLGSIAIRETIERVQPRLVVCGHIHSSAGQQVKLGKTPVINAGPHGVAWSLND